MDSKRDLRDLMDYGFRLADELGSACDPVDVWLQTASREAYVYTHLCLRCKRLLRPREWMPRSVEASVFALATGELRLLCPSLVFGSPAAVHFRAIDGAGAAPCGPSRQPCAACARPLAASGDDALLCRWCASRSCGLCARESAALAARGWHERAAHAKNASACPRCALPLDAPAGARWAHRAAERDPALPFAAARLRL
jgi:hypothetical protein